MITTKYVRTLVAVVAPALLLAVSASAQQRQSLSPEQVAAIKKEVTAALQTYYRLYTEKDSKSVGPDVYMNPSIALRENGPVYQPTDQRQKEYADRVAKAGDGWGRFEYPNPIVCVLHANAAIASGEFVSYRQDGSKSPSGGTYIFGRTPQGWRIASFIPHATGKVVRCE